MPDENRSQTLACFPCAFSQLICVSGLFILTSAGHNRVIIDWQVDLPTTMKESYYISLEQISSIQCHQNHAVINLIHGQLTMYER